MPLCQLKNAGRIAHGAGRRVRGALTDLIIDRAIEQRAKVAVLTCCHNLKASPTDGLEGWMVKALAVDTVRALKLRSSSKP